MRAHFLQHVPFEGLGSISPWLFDSGYEITGTQFFQSSSLPDINEVDILIVMGGPMSVNDENELPWLVSEKKFIREAVQTGKPVLGICLGAQLIANAMGSKVFCNPVKEIGWFPVQGIKNTDDSIFKFPPSMEVFHWHGETFDLPHGAVRLATSEGCVNQAFQIGKSVIGLQFHLEMTKESVREIVTHCRAELMPAKYIQSEAEILAASPEKYQVTNNLMSKLMYFLEEKNR